MVDGIGDPSGYDRPMLSILDLAIIEVLRHVDPDDQPRVLARTKAAALASGGEDAAAQVQERIDCLRRYVAATTPRIGGFGA